MRGIILAGGRGTRLYPITLSVSKQLLPIYDKPLIYYPLSVLLLAKIKDVLIISTPDDIDQYKRLLGNGSRIGINISYKVQYKARGLADAFIIGEDFIGDESVCLVLGDNVFYGTGLTDMLLNAKGRQEGATIFGYPVSNANEYGVVEFDANGTVLSIEEKPTDPKSHFAVPGLYFYDNSVVDIAKRIQPSDRGEIEITSINNHYLEQKKLFVELMPRGMAWLDTGSPSGMLQASQFVEAVQKRQGFYISCIEEIAWRKGFITYEKMIALGNEMKNTDYGKYILSLKEED